VVIDNLNIGRAAIGSDEADAELIVDANAVLTHPVTFERLQPITRRRAQNFSVLAASSCASLRSATDWIDRNRLGLPPSNRASVSAHRKDWIINRIYYV